MNPTDHSGVVDHDELAPAGDPSQPPRQSAVALARERSIASLKAALAVALLLAASIGNPALGLFVLPLLPLPYALTTLRYGPIPAVAVSVGLAIAGLTTGLAGGSALDAAALAAFMTGTAGWLAITLAATGIERPFQRVPLATMTVGYLALTIVLGGLILGSVGADGVRTGIAGSVRDAYDDGLVRNCGAGKPLASYEAYCDRLRTDRDRVVKVTQRHGLVVAAVIAAIYALSNAATSLILLRMIAPKRGFAVDRLGRLRDWHAHWSNAYLLAGGLLLTMAGLQLGATDGAVVAAGAVAVAIGASLLVVDGLAVAVFFAARWRVRRLVRVALVILSLLAWPYALGWLLSLGMLDVMARLRERAGPGSNAPTTTPG